MRVLIKLLIVLAVIWCGWWALATYGVSQALNGWLEERRAAGWAVEAETAQGGFPMNIQTNVAALSLSNPEAQSTLTLNGGALKARTYWPGHVDLDLPETPITLDLPGGQLALEAAGARSALRLRPGFALELGSFRITSGAWRVVVYGQELIKGADFTLLADQDGGNRNRYAVTLASAALAPGALPRQFLSLPASWPTAFESFTATGSVRFDAPLTAQSFEDTPPQLRGLSIAEADIIWGALGLRATGDLSIDAQGIATGQMNVQARNWRELVDLAVTTGLMPEDRRFVVELALGAVASQSGQPENLDVALTFADGGMAMNGAPLPIQPRFRLP